MATSAEVGARYAARADALRAQRAAQAATVDRLGYLRLAAFAASGLLLARWATANAFRGLWLALAVGAFVVFALLVRTSNRARARLQRTDDLITLADEGGHRVARAWDLIPQRPWAVEPPTHPYAVDLDLFGEASLVQLMPAMTQAPGRATLRQWLAAPADPATIHARQRAIAELRTRDAVREDLAVAGMRIGASDEALGALTRWAAGDPWLHTRRGLVALTALLPVATIALVLAQATGVVPHPYWIAPAAAGWLLVSRSARRLRDGFGPVVGRANMLRRYAAMARLVADHPVDAPLLASIRQRLAAPASAHAEMRRLTALADCTELRLSPMLYAIVNTLTLWDFHVVHLIERWQRRSGAHVADWMAALGEFESLSALATLAHDNPEWAFPELAPDARSPSIDAEGLGHPLLADGTGVRNDVTVGPAGTILVVTGSNMAGKSTLLRSIGLNLVLSQAGSVVCARRLRHPPATLYTSMRVQDSLQRGVSYFMAELERLKMVVDAADGTAAGDGRAFVYLLDEILHGTNSAERTIAARHVLRHLVGTGAIGAVSTHDLQLVDDPELAAVARHVHFREQFSRANGSAAMTFDYRLRAGKATSSNALKLLELVGLKDVEPS
jgi:MutS domain V